MAKGTFAKENIKKKLAECFGNDYIGEVDKKIYIWQDDGGERVQIALALTCPKTFVDIPDKNPIEKTEDWDFSDDSPKIKSTPKATITEEEKQRVADLMKSLGL